MPVTYLAREHDAEVVVDLITGFRDWYGRADPPRAAIKAVVDRLLGDPSTLYVLGAAESGAAPSAIAQVRFRPSVWTGVEDCWLEDLFVRPDVQRTGLGRAVLTRVVDEARGRGCRRVELDVDASNEPARALYASAGFSLDYKPPGPNLLMGCWVGEEDAA